MPSSCPWPVPSIPLLFMGLISLGVSVGMESAAFGSLGISVVSTTYRLLSVPMGSRSPMSFIEGLRHRLSFCTRWSHGSSRSTFPAQLSLSADGS